MLGLSEAERLQGGSSPDLAARALAIGEALAHPWIEIHSALALAALGGDSASAHIERAHRANGKLKRRRADRNDDDLAIRTVAAELGAGREISGIRFNLP